MLGKNLISGDLAVRSMIQSCFISTSQFFIRMGLKTKINRDVSAGDLNVEIHLFFLKKDLTMIYYYTGWNILKMGHSIVSMFQIS